MSAPRLTPHQQEVLGRIERLAGRSRGHAPAEWIGSKGAVDKLVAKGYVQRIETGRGLRGAVRYGLRPIPQWKAGDRCGVPIGTGSDRWLEPGTVTEVTPKLVTVELDETLELPTHLGGGWLKITEREHVELETLA